MNINIAMSLDRADELLAEMGREYDQSLKSRLVSPRAVHFTHEVCERLRSVLDRLARLYWDRNISPSLADDDKSKAAVYFPVTGDMHAFNSVMGRWRWKDTKGQHCALNQFLLDVQPFSKQENDWLRILNELAIASKHIDLVPQTMIEERRVTVSGSGGSVSWGAGVTFGNGVSIMGAPVNPSTQRIVPTAGLTEKIEVWVSFLIQGHNVNAFGFCRDVCKNVRDIAERMTKEFDL